jgi:hypothetical protein
MKNVLKLTALLAVFASAGMHAETEKVKVAFPEFLHKSHYDKFPCQFYAQDPDGTMFVWVKIDHKHPHAIAPTNVLVFRNKAYAVKEIQEFGQEDFAEVESPSECISIMILPLSNLLSYLLE